MHDLNLRPSGYEPEKIPTFFQKSTRFRQNDNYGQTLQKTVDPLAGGGYYAFTGVACDPEGWRKSKFFKIIKLMVGNRIFGPQRTEIRPNNINFRRFFIC